MRTKKSFSENLGFMVAFTSGGGGLTMLVAMVINLVFFNGNNEIWDAIAVVGAMLWMLPFFMGQFILPSGLLGPIGSQTDIPFWGKAIVCILVYILFFPFVNMWMLIGVNYFFNFLPDYRAAMTQGFSKEIVQAMRCESTAQAWTIIAVTSTTMIVLGLIVRGVLRKKFNLA